MYCIHCGKDNKDIESGVCKFCGAELITNRELDHEEERTLSQHLHDRFNKSREIVDNALVFIVLGATLMIIGALFFFLAHKVDQDTFEKVLKISCTEFWVSMAGLGVGGALFIVGWVRFIVQKVTVQKPVMRTIKRIQNHNYVHVEVKEK